MVSGSMAIRAGLVIGMIQKAMARREPDLVPVLPGPIEIKLNGRLAVHEDQKHEHAIRAVLDGLATGLGQWLEAAAAS